MIMRWFRQFEIKRGKFVEIPNVFTPGGAMAQRYVEPKWLREKEI